MAFFFVSLAQSQDDERRVRSDVAAAAAVEAPRAQGLGPPTGAPSDGAAPHHRAARRPGPQGTAAAQRLALVRVEAPQQQQPAPSQQQQQPPPEQQQEHEDPPAAKVNSPALTSLGEVGPVWVWV